MPLLTRGRMLTLLGLALTGAAAYARWVEPEWLKVRYVQVTIPRLPAAFHDYRIAHISDIHMGGWMTRERLLAAVELVNLIQPDLVAITGDFVDRHAGMLAADLAGPLHLLEPRDATVAVMGNHDYYSGVNGVRRVLRECGIIELANVVHTVRRGDDQLHIAGVDDVAERQASLDAVLDQLPADGPAVLLAHEPDFADVAAPTGRFDVQLSGHTHGGQLRLPGVGALVLPSYGKRYPAGRYQVGDMVQYTNRGLGMIKPYLRFNARPELTVVILEKPWH
jgi:uncharacterized protein